MLSTGEDGKSTQHLSKTRQQAFLELKKVWARIWRSPLMSRPQHVIESPKRNISMIRSRRGSSGRHLQERGNGVLITATSSLSSTASLTQSSSIDMQLDPRSILSCGSISPPPSSAASLQRWPSFIFIFMAMCSSSSSSSSSSSCPLFCLNCAPSTSCCSHARSIHQHQHHLVDLLPPRPPSSLLLSLRLHRRDGRSARRTAAKKGGLAGLPRGPV
eukprot:m.149665 g.149665  ORF g.149665 m.149665 type:complete len:216 (-) comp16159_c4_seq1:2324-2971(-)